MRGGGGDGKEPQVVQPCGKGTIPPGSCCADVFTEFTHAVFSTLGLNVRWGVRVCGCVCVCVCECLGMPTSVFLNGCCGPGLGDLFRIPKATAEQVIQWNWYFPLLHTKVLSWQLKKIWTLHAAQIQFYFKERKIWTWNREFWKLVKIRNTTVTVAATVKSFTWVKLYTEDY